MTRGYAALTILICALWASVGIVTKLCLAEAPPFGLASIRMLIAALALWFWIKVRRHERQDWSCWPILMVATALFCSLLAFTHLGFNLTSAASGIVLLNTTPLFVAVVAFAANKEPISLAKASGLVLAFIGVVTIFADRVGGVGESITGDAFMLVAAISWSFQILWTKQAARGVDAGMLTLAQFTGAALVLGVLTMTTEAPTLWHLTPRLASGIVYLAIAGTVVPWLLWAYVLKNVAASTASAYIFSVPLIGVAMSSLLLGEHVSAPFLAGAILVSLGIVVVSRIKQVPGPRARGNVEAQRG